MRRFNEIRTFRTLATISAPNAAVVVILGTRTMEFSIGRRSNSQKALFIIGWNIDFDIQHCEFTKSPLQDHVTRIDQPDTKQSWSILARYRAVKFRISRVDRCREIVLSIFIRYWSCHNWRGHCSRTKPKIKNRHDRKLLILFKIY